jgi:iron complex transport system substrate-binding protein
MKRVLCAALAACLLLSGGCANKPQPDGRFPVEAAGVTIGAPPKRVVTLTPAVTETIFSLGYGGRVVGVGEQCDPPVDRPIAACGSLLLPDIDRILALAPDLVVSSAPLPTEADEALAQAGIPILTVRYAETLEGVFENYKTLCTAFEGEERAAFLTEQLRYFADVTLGYTAEQTAGALGEKNTAIYLRSLPFVIATGDTIEGRLLSDFGFFNQAEPYTGWSYPPEFEPQLNPDYLFCDRSVQPDALEESVYYRQTGAVSQGRVYFLDAVALERQSPRMFLELERVMREAFPDAFEQREKPSIVLPMPQPEPEPQKTWWQRLFGG